ncbi:MAG: hypothetical protein IJW73_09395 [Candidatus Gastranaerophilales bacterium]|nr:hypothetical protein [Candidatus Gastranaerophilales bacterium]
MSIKRVFFLGAGFSKGLNKEYPTLDELTEKVIKILNEKYKNNPVLQHYESIPDIVKNNIENLLSYLYVRLPWQDSVEYNLDKALYSALTNIICEYIKTLSKNIENPTFYKLGKFMDIPHIKPINKIYKFDNHIISLNYDEMYTYLEADTNEKNNITEIGKDCIIIVPAPNNKLNMQYKDEKAICVLDKIPECISVTSYQRTLLKKILLMNYKTYKNIKYEELNNILKEKFGDGYIFPREKYNFKNISLAFSSLYKKIIQLHGSINERCVEENGKYRKIDKKEDTYKDISMPYIIPPVLDKSIFYNNPDMQALWHKAHSILSEANEIYIIGFSFPQTDIAVKFLFQSALKASSAKIYVINNSTKDELCSNYKYIFDDNLNVDYTYCGSENALLKFSKEFINNDNVE